MRTGGQTYYLLGDHLGSTNVTANSIGVQISKLLYKPWGEQRYSAGTTPTAWRFTGQREDATIGRYSYNARYLDPQLGRFAQADIIVPEPGDPQTLNRYSYTLNNPVKYIDSSGHFAFIPILVGVAIIGLISYDYLAHPDIAYAPELNVDVGSLPPSDLPDNDAALCGPCPYIQERQWAMAGVMGAVELTPLDELPGMNRLIRETVETATEHSDLLIRAMPEDQIGTSQGFKLRKGEDGISVFEDVSPGDVLAEVPGGRVANTTVGIPRSALPEGTEVRPTRAPSLSQRLSDAHRVLIRPEGSLCVYNR